MDRSDFDTDRSVLQEWLNAAERGRDELEDMARQLEKEACTQRARAEALAAELQGREREVAKLEALVEECKEQVRGLLERLALYDRATDSDKLQARCLELEGENMKLQTRCNNSDSELSSALQNHAKEKQALETSITQLQKELAALAEKAGPQHKDMAQQNKALTQRVEELQAAIARVEEVKNDLVAERAAYIAAKELAEQATIKVQGQCAQFEQIAQTRTQEQVETAQALIQCQAELTQAQTDIMQMQANMQLIERASAQALSNIEMQWRTSVSHMESLIAERDANLAATGAERDDAAKQVNLMRIQLATADTARGACFLRACVRVCLHSIRKLSVA
jgi:chromosome segregation ATPase